MDFLEPKLWCLSSLPGLGAAADTGVEDRHPCPPSSSSGESSSDATLAAFSVAGNSSGWRLLLFSSSSSGSSSAASGTSSRMPPEAAHAGQRHLNVLQLQAASAARSVVGLGEAGQFSSVFSVGGIFCRLFILYPTLRVGLLRRHPPITEFINTGARVTGL